MDDLLQDGFLRMLEKTSSPAVVRRAEQGEVADILEAVTESGFLDALVPEASGGFGLPLSDVAPLFIGAAEHLLPLPFAETTVGRALIALAGMKAPANRMISLWPLTTDGRLRSQLPPSAPPPSLALVQRDATCHLLAARVRAKEHDPFRMVVTEPDFDTEPILSFTLPAIDLFDWAAAISAANIAGAALRVLSMSLTHVNDRQQFGRPLARFQVIQHQLSVLAEKTALAQVAARIGLSGPGLALSRWRVAVAKTVTNEAASACAGVAHGLHGAIGISAEHDLQLYTRRLNRWRLSFGSEEFWARHIGSDRKLYETGTSVDLVRARLSAGG